MERKKIRLRFESNVIGVEFLMNTEQETCENEKDEAEIEILCL